MPSTPAPAASGRPQRRAFWPAVFAVALTGCAGAYNGPVPAPAGAPPAGLEAVAARALPPPLCAANPQPPPSEISGQPGYRQFALSIVSRSGYPMSGLTASDFTVAVGGQSVPISYFREQSAAPASVVLVIDPLFVRNPEAVRKAAGAFLERLNPCDEVGLVGLGSMGSVVQPMTTDHALAAGRLELVRQLPRSALYADIEVALTMLAGAHHPRRAVVVVAGYDGDRFRVRKDSPYALLFEELPTVLSGSGAQIYAILIGRAAVRSPFDFPPFSPGRGPDVVTAPALHQLAAASGGAVVTVPPQDSGGVRPLMVAAAGLARSVEHDYLVGLAAPPNPHQALEIRIASAPEAELAAAKSSREPASLPRPWPRAGLVGRSRKRRPRYYATNQALQSSQSRSSIRRASRSPASSSRTLLSRRAGTRCR